MSEIGPVEVFVMIFAGIFSIGIPIATLVLVILIYRNTRK
jgi:hypothetical protein